MYDTTMFDEFATHVVNRIDNTEVYWSSIRNISKEKVTDCFDRVGLDHSNSKTFLTRGRSAYIKLVYTFLGSKTDEELQSLMNDVGSDGLPSCIDLDAYSEYRSRHI